MANLVDIAFVVSIVYLAWKGKQVTAVQILLAGIFLAPVFTLGQYKFSFSYLGVAGLLSYMLTVLNTLKVSRFGRLPFVFFALVSVPVLELLSTLLSIAAGAASTILWIRFLGMLKNILLCFAIAVVAYNGFRKEKEYCNGNLIKLLAPVFQVVMVANLAAVVIQVLWPSVGFEIVSRWYTSETHSTIESIRQGGSFLRAYGLNYSPVLLGLESLVCFVSSLFGLDQGLEAGIRRRLRTILAISFVNGIFSFSKTFFLGASLLLLLYVLKLAGSILKTGSIRIRSIMLLVFVIACFAIVVANSGSFELATGLPFGYYYGRIAGSPLEALKTRYTYEFVPADTKLTYDVIRANPIWGVGYTAPLGEFIGDSEYLSALHSGGIVSLALRLFILAFFAHLALRRRDTFFLGILFVCLIGGAAAPTLYSETFLALIGGFLGSFVQDGRKYASPVYGDKASKTGDTEWPVSVVPSERCGSRTASFR